MPATTSDSRQLPRPMINWFEGADTSSRICPKRLANQIFTVRPCKPAPGQPVIDAILVAELRSEN